MNKEKEQLGEEGEITEEEKFLLQQKEQRQKHSVGLGTLILGRILFGRFSKK